MRPWRTALFLCLLFCSTREIFALRALGPEIPCTGFFEASVSRARYFNPQTGRFWTADLFEGNRTNPLSLHRYLYAQDNPVNLIDPTGHFVSSAEVAVSTSIGIAISAYLTYQVAAPLYYRAKVNSLKTELKTIQEQTELFECYKFVEEAADLMKRKGKREMSDWWIIYYKSADPVWSANWKGEIWADNGFGRYGGQKISETGIHYGILVRFMGELINDLVSDNNVLLVPKRAWTSGYMVYDRPFPPRSFIAIRQAADKGLGEIKEISYSDFRNMR